MRLNELWSPEIRADKSSVLAALAFLVASVALVDMSPLAQGYSLGFLYLLPILLGALHLNRKEILGLALLCMVLREALGPFDHAEGLAVRTALGLLAFGGSGLSVFELAARRRRRVEERRQLEEQARLREAAEQQLRVLIETSPAAILTMDPEGEIRLANQAAHAMLGLEPDSLTGAPIGRYFPPLAGVACGDGTDRIFRTMLECKGRRSSGDVFPAHVWLSSFVTVSGPMFAAIILDTSEELRDREALGFDQLMNSSRILIRAVSHEIRNLCAAIAVVHANLRRVPGIERSEDYQALGTLVEGLGKLVSSELRAASQRTPASLNLAELLQEFRIIVEPSFAEEDVALDWSIPEDLPPVFAERHGLLHIFMNLASNSRRALRGALERRMEISAKKTQDRVTVTFADTGPGVAHPERLFQPFQHASEEGAGVGLYLSRALARSFAGDLRYEPGTVGSRFWVELPAARRDGGPADLT